MGEQQTTLIESSINSVRVSVQIKKGQDLEVLLTRLLERFLTIRADKFEILRRKTAKEGFDFSFLISAEHLQKYHKSELINFILEFIQGISKEITEMKLDIMKSSANVARFYTNGLASNDI